MLIRIINHFLLNNLAIFITIITLEICINGCILKIMFNIICWGLIALIGAVNTQALPHLPRNKNAGRSQLNIIAHARLNSWGKELFLRR